MNVSREAGTAVPHVWGIRDDQRYIIEVKGSGLGFIDFDHDGWLDIYLTNGVAVRRDLHRRRPRRSLIS